jgi:hypothetical protein
MKKMAVSILITTILKWVVTIMSHVNAALIEFETINLDLLHVSPTTAFRVFPTLETAATMDESDLYHWRANYVSILLSLALHVVWQDVDRMRGGLATQLTKPLRARSHTFAVVFYIVRIWVVVAIWHHFLFGLAKSDGPAWTPGFPWREWLTMHLL